MNDPKETEDVGEIKRLLERLQELTPSADAALGRLSIDGALPPAANPYAFHQQMYPQLQLAGPAVEPARRSPTMNPWLFVMATALNTIVAAVLAVLITLGVVRQEPGYAEDNERTRPAPVRIGTDTNSREGLATGTFAMPAAKERVASQAPAQPVRLQAVGSPELPLRMEPNKPSPIPIELEPEAARRDSYILVLSGLPAGASLAGAERIGSDSWLLTPDAMTRLSLTIPEWSASLFEIVIELRRTNGAFAAESRAWLMVPPPAMAKASKTADQTALKDLLDRSGQLLARGDVVAARTLYERAADMGSGAAALALGGTYDPNRLWSLGVFGMVGNKERARQWYARAEQLGHPEAKERMRALGE